jgi:carboxylesterase type B
MLLSQVLQPFLVFSLVGAVDPLVKLGYTSYQGMALGNGISQWLGLRYAAAPVGDLRFAAPQDPPKNSSVQIANKVSHPPSNSQPN